MENATKALLIAAAILIAIVLISIGVYVLSIGQQAVTGADMTEQEIATFNSKFTSYEGSHVMGSKVNALLQAVASSNIQEGTQGKRIKISYPSTEGNVNAEIEKVEKKVNTGNSYTVKCDTNSTGLVNTITVTQNPN